MVARNLRQAQAKVIALWDRVDSLEREWKRLSIACELGELTPEKEAQYKALAESLVDINLSVTIAKLEVKRQELLEKAKESAQEKQQCLREAVKLDKAIATLKEATTR